MAPVHNLKRRLRHSFASFRDRFFQRGRHATPEPFRHFSWAHPCTSAGPSPFLAHYHILIRILQAWILWILYAVIVKQPAWTPDNEPEDSRLYAQASFYALFYTVAANLALLWPIYEFPWLFQVQGVFVVTDFVISFYFMPYLCNLWYDGPERTVPGVNGFVEPVWTVRLRYLHYVHYIAAFMSCMVVLQGAYWLFRMVTGRGDAPLPARLVRSLSQGNR